MGNKSTGCFYAVGKSAREPESEPYDPDVSATFQNERQGQNPHSPPPNPSTRANTTSNGASTTCAPSRLTQFSKLEENFYWYIVIVIPFSVKSEYPLSRLYTG